MFRFIVVVVVINRAAIIYIMATTTKSWINLRGLFLFYLKVQAPLPAVGQHLVELVVAEEEEVAEIQVPIAAEEVVVIVVIVVVVVVVVVTAAIADGPHRSKLSAGIVELPSSTIAISGGSISIGVGARVSMIRDWIRVWIRAWIRNGIRG
jgi:hypothetical protein